MSYKLSNDPTANELKKFSNISLKKNRMFKKFRKNIQHYVSTEIFHEFLGKLFSAPISRKLDYSNLFKCLNIKEV